MRITEHGAAHDIGSVPPPKRLPAMALWLFVRGLSAADLSRKTGRSRAAAAAWLRDFDNPTRVVPPPDVIAACRSWTGGEVTADDWHDAAAEGTADSAPAGEGGQ